jgi:hypothetical protein
MGWFKISLAFIAPVVALAGSCGGQSATGPFEDAGATDDGLGGTGGAAGPSKT